MLWLIVPLAAVVFLFFSGFRKSAGALLLAASIAAGVLYRLEVVDEQRATDRISASEISLQDVNLRRTFDSTYELTGTISNRSGKYRIDAITVSLTLRDCRSAGDSACQSIGEESADVLVSVLPQQTRSFVATFYLGKEHRPPRGSLAWEHEIAAIRASLP